MRSILEGKIYLIRNFEKEKLNNLIINNKLTLRIFLQKQSLYRKEHLKYLLSGINSFGGEITTKKSTVLLCNSLVHSRGSFLSFLNTKFISDGTPPGRRRMSTRKNFLSNSLTNRRGSILSPLIIKTVKKLQVRSYVKETSVFLYNFE